MRGGIDRTNLVHAAQTGDPAAISRLLAVCQADARRYAYKHCQVSDVDDAVQESLLIIARKVKGLKAAAAFSSWLFTVIKRKCRKLERMMSGTIRSTRNLPSSSWPAAPTTRCGSTWPTRSNQCPLTTWKWCCCATSRNSRVREYMLGPETSTNQAGAGV